jgi:hypothetical protein
MARFEFASDQIPALPPLAWLVEAFPSGEARLLHGRGVQVHAHGFREGCMAAPDGDDLATAAEVFGSGLSTRGDRWIFVPPSHTLEALYLYRHRRGFSISNSLAFLTAHHGLLPPWSSSYGARFASAMLGIDAYDRLLWRTPEGDVVRFIYDNVELAPDGRFETVRKPMPPPFGSFEEYVAYLRRTLALAFADAAPYRPLATCSSGYDSACAAALLAALGTREAVTLRNARGGDVDSGKPIGELLGFTVHEFERPGDVAGPFDDLADFLATGMGGEDYCYQAFGQMLPGRALVTGFHGDKIWDVNTKPNTVLVRGDVSGASLQEYRLRMDFVHIPVPMIGARRHPEIAAISRSAEMEAYRLGNDYDRPIPRRVLEGAGVPRTLFGQRKKAASIHLFKDRGGPVWGAAARRDFDAAMPAEWARRFARDPARVTWALRFRGYRWLQRHARNAPRVRALQHRLVRNWRIFGYGNPGAALKFGAGLLLVARRYREALRTATSSEAAPAFSGADRVGRLAEMPRPGVPPAPPTAGAPDAARDTVDAPRCDRGTP